MFQNNVFIVFNSFKNKYIYIYIVASNSINILYNENYNYKYNKFYGIYLEFLIITIICRSYRIQEMYKDTRLQ